MFYYVSPQKKRSWMNRMKEMLQEHRGHKKLKHKRCPKQVQEVNERLLDKKITFDTPR